MPSTVKCSLTIGVKLAVKPSSVRCSLTTGVKLAVKPCSGTWSPTTGITLAKSTSRSSRKMVLFQLFASPRPTWTGHGRTLWSPRSYRSLTIPRTHSNQGNQYKSLRAASRREPAARNTLCRTHPSQPSADRCHTFGPEESWRFWIGVGAFCQNSFFLFVRGELISDRQQKCILTFILCWDP